MPLHHMALGAGLSLGLMTGAAQAAAVEYSLYRGGKGDMFSLHVDYISQSFIVADTKIGEDDLAACGSFLVACTSATFLPGTAAAAPFKGKIADEVFVETESASGGADAPRFDFDPGTFGQLGHFTSFDGYDGVATLDISLVPIPASAPLFGAALAALGAVGYGLKRKNIAAATA